MPEPTDNIVLIGMAGSGKSSIGRRIARKLSRPFIDTDELIKEKAGRPLQQIIEKQGLSSFRQFEENVLVGLHCTNHVIATGGSSVYSGKGMRHLKKNGYVIFLDVGLDILIKRITDFADRGLVKQPDQSFSELYTERKPLYLQYADLIYPCGEKSEAEICNALIDIIKEKTIIDTAENKA